MTQRHRLEVIPLVSLADVVEIGEIAIGPFKTIANSVYPAASVRKIAKSMVNYHRQYNGAAITNPSLIGSAQRGPLPVQPSSVEAVRHDRSVEAFRYVALLTDRLGHGPNSTHLHVERYGFREGSGVVESSGGGPLRRISLGGPC